MDKLMDDFSFGLFFWVTLVFVILILLMRKFAWKPILDALNSREEHISKALKQAESARNQLEKFNIESTYILKEARNQRDEILKEANEIKNSIVEQAKKEAKFESDTILKDAKISIEIEKKMALNDAKSKIADLSIKIAKNILHSELSSEEKQSNLIEKFLKELSL